MARSAVQTALSLLYAGAVGGSVVVALLAIEESGTGSVSNETAASLGLGLAAYVVLAGLGLMGPRRQLVRLLSATARDRRTVSVVGLGAAAATVVVLLVAWLDVPHWAPLSAPYEAFDALRDTLYDTIDQIQQSGS
jgi:hypothetical protein